MVLLVVSVALALGLSAMCSLFEAVLYSVPLSTLDVMEKSGKASGRVFKRLRSDVQKPITAILTLNTIANTAGAAIAGAAAVAVLGPKWLFGFSVAFTLGILLFSEIIPKTVGVYFGKSFVRVVAFPIQLIVWVFSPVVFVINGIVGILSPKKEKQVSPQEIASMASLSRKEGSIEFLEEKVIENVLSLKEKKAKDIMTPRTVVFSLDKNMTLADAKKAAGQWPHSRVPVFNADEDDVVGFVMRRDVFNALTDGKKTESLEKFMRPLHFVPALAKLDRLLKDFLEKRQHQFGVIDEYGGFSGIVTLEDVLEEIIGREIVDEFDTAVDMGELARKRRKEVMRQKG